MSANFPLAGLLRYRRLREEQAAGSLAGANARLRENNERRERVLQALESGARNTDNLESLHAVAAARAAARSMLAELEAVDNRVRTEVHHAQAVYNAARTQAIGLEKLEGRYAETVAAEDLRAQQGLIDELASVAWQRGQEGNGR